MLDRVSILFRSAALAAALSLGACQAAEDEAELASLDNQIAGNEADPALTSALEDQIMVDPNLAQQSNRNAIRPPETPTQAQYPLPQQGVRDGTALKAGQPPVSAATAGVRNTYDASGAPARPAGAVRASAASQSSGAGVAATGCGAELQYSPEWASRLPAAFPLYPGARVTESAGIDRADCRMRVITFATNAPAQHMLDWYHTKAVRAGYTSEHQLRDADHILAGVNGRDGGAFYLVVTPLPGNRSSVALIANKGG
jgi:hypothetical protein